MRAWRVHDLGDPVDVLRLEETTLTEPVDDQVEVAVAACALNFADDLICRGTYQEHPTLPFTPGMELAGTVVAAGTAATHPVGTRVVGAPVLGNGGLAERALAHSHDVFPLPDSIDDVTAAALHVTYQTGWFALHRRARLQAGETLLVHAGAGGVGSAAVQLGRAAGARVIATAGGPDKVARCLELGADLALDHRTEDVVAAVLDATGGRGADVVFDPVGGDTFERSTHCIAWEGRLLVIGAASGTYAPARTNHILVKNYGVLGVHWGGYRSRRPDLVAEAHDRLMALHAAGAVAPLVSDVLPLTEAPAALARLTSGRTTGKLVLVP
jgi:NADPH2:quinone reductase